MSAVAFSSILPELVVALTGIVVLVIDFVLPRGGRRMVGYLAVLGLALAWFVLMGLLVLGPLGSAELAPAFLGDAFSVVLRLLFTTVGMLVLLAAIPGMEERGRYQGEHYALVVFAVLGMSLMAAAGELVTLYISIELSSICLYVLAAFNKRDARSSEAGLKYLLFGALSSAILLYGLALLYGLSGSTDLRAIASPLRSLSTPLTLAVVFVLAGVGFKMAVVPFHMWAPDVYEGAPTPITAFLSTGSKASGFAVAIRLLMMALPNVRVEWAAVVAVLAVLTMTVGNLVAIPQTNIKRLLAYSSIAHAGYMLVGLTAATRFGLASVLYYLLAYAFTNLAAFAVIIAVSNALGTDEIARYAGLRQRAPWLAFALLVALLSLLGIPPLAGLFGKFFLFWAAIQAGYAWLVVIAVINSVVSAYYYLRIAREMYLRDADSPEPVRVGFSLGVVVVVTTVGVALFGILSSPLLALMEQAARALTG